HGYFSDNDAVIKQINDSCADMVFIAMGSPRQEIWLAEHRDRIDAPYCMGVGGSFDVLSGSVRRAPRLFCSTGTEWLYRLVTEPHRFRRQKVLPLFALSVAWQFLVAKLMARDPR
ncbi:MAG: WecB/TagA/CpsF family glycosyltransferase, partial [Phycisphaerales bacterium]